MRGYRNVDWAKRYLLYNIENGAWQDFFPSKIGEKKIETRPIPVTIKGQPDILTAHPIWGNPLVKPEYAHVSRRIIQ